MGVDVRKVVETVRDDLKKLYCKDPTAVWGRPFVVIVRRGSDVGYLDTDKSPQEINEWIQSYHDKDNITDVVVGTMAVEYGALKGVDGNPVVKKKAILVTGRNLSNGRTVVSVTYANEHRDYRSAEVIEKQGQLENPGVKSPDVTKAIIGEDDKSIVGWMTGQFGKELIHDSKEGNRCIDDPLIRGVIDPSSGTGGGGA